MPFDLNDYQRRITKMTDGELHEEYRRYCKHLEEATVSSFLGGLFAIPTAGLSLVATAYGAGQGANAAMKLAAVKDEKARRAGAL